MRKKRILILSSRGGYGHVASANTLKALIGDMYEIDVAYPINELRLCGFPSGEKFYNWLISNNFTTFTNWIVRRFCHRLFPNASAKATRLIRSYIESKQADLVISVIPFINASASHAAHLCGIPFLLVTTDNDLTNWVLGMEHMEMARFKVTYGFDLESTRGLLDRAGVDEEAMEPIGLPLRPNFLKVESRDALRAKYGILEGKNVALVMMGGAGSKVTIKYVKALLAHIADLHVLVCTGRSQSLAKKLKALTSAKGSTLDVIPFTENIHELLALSDLFITKPGPGSINEAYALKVPMLIDHTTAPLFWEQANIDMVLRDGVGACIHKIEEIPGLVAQFLFDEQVRERAARAYEHLPENRFARAIPELVAQLLQTSTSSAVDANQCESTCS